MFCQNCGNKIEEDARFCSFCGTKVKLILEQQSGNTTIVAINKTPQESKKTALDQITRLIAGVIGFIIAKYLGFLTIILFVFAWFIGQWFPKLLKIFGNYF